MSISGLWKNPDGSCAGHRVKQNIQEPLKVLACIKALALAFSPLSKGYKVIKELGGIKEFAELLLGGAMTKGDLWNFVKNVGGEVSGIGGVIGACFI